MRTSMIIGSTAAVPEANTVKTGSMSAVPQTAQYWRRPAQSMKPPMKGEATIETVYTMEARREAASAWLSWASHGHCPDVRYFLASAAAAQ